MKKVTCFLLVVCMVLVSLTFLGGKVARAATTYPIIEAENYNSVSGSPTKVSNYASNNGTHLINVNDGTALVYNNVDFLSGAASIQMRIATPRTGGTVEVRLGSASGTLIATVSIPNTHEWTANLGIDWSNGWRAVSTAINGGPTGPQTVVLVFRNPAGGRVADFDWFRLLGAPTSTTYYVSTSGNDSNNGSSSSPFRTINKAASLVLPGDTVDVAGGVYSEQVNLKSINSGTAQNRVTIRSHAGQVAVIDGSGLAVSNLQTPVVNARADYLTFDGFEIRNGAGAGITGDGDFMILQNLKVHNNKGAGVGVWDSEGTQILNNEVYSNVTSNMPLGSNTSGGWAAAMISYHAYTTTFSGNFSHDNGGEGIIAAPDSFYFTISNNVVRDNWSVGIYLDGAHNTMVERNLVYDTETSYIPWSNSTGRNLMTAYGSTDEDYSYWGAAGTWGCGTPGYTPAQSNTFRNNIAVNTRYGFAYTWQYLSCSGLIKDVIENNTFVGTWQEAVKLAPGAHSGSVFRNNILNSKGSSDSTRVLIAQDRNDTTFENNLFWTADGNPSGKFLFRTDEAYSPSTDFTAWAAGDHVAANGWGNPTLVALASLTGDIAANQKLTTSSAVAIDKGTTNGAPTIDYWGSARPAGQSIDIGASEFGGVAIVPTTVPTVIPPTATSLPPTSTAIPNTPVPTFVPPTNTVVPNTPAPTFVPPTYTPAPGNTSVPPTTVQTVTPAPGSVSAITVQYLPGNATASSNQIQPRLKIVNTSSSSIAMSQFTIRYYFTPETSASLAFACQSAQVGCANVKGRFTQLSAPTTTASFYMELYFTGGTLPANGDSGEMWTRINKSDWSAFNQSNDYSFGSTVTTYTEWSKMALYRNGVMIWGTVPGVTSVPTNTPIPPTNTPAPSATPVSAPANVSPLRMQYRTTDPSATDNQIRPQFKLFNDNTTAMALSGVTFRYYFTNEGNQPLQFTCDFADAGCGNVSAKFVTISPAVTGANTYMEISFTGSAPTLAAGGSSLVMGRINKTDWSAFNESDDYSAKLSQTSFADWMKITVYRNGGLLWGTPAK